MSQVKSIAIIALVAMTLSGCTSNKFEILYTKPCSTVVPESQTKRTPGAPLPTVDGDESWFAFGDKQTGRLDQANNRADNNLEMIKRCEEHDRSAILVPKQKVIGVSIKKK